MDDDVIVQGTTEWVPFFIWILGCKGYAMMIVGSCVFRAAVRASRLAHHSLYLKRGSVDNTETQEFCQEGHSVHTQC